MTNAVLDIDDKLKQISKKLNETIDTRTIKKYYYLFKNKEINDKLNNSENKFFYMNYTIDKLNQINLDKNILLKNNIKKLYYNITLNDTKKLSEVLTLVYLDNINYLLEINNSINNQKNLKKDKSDFLKPVEQIVGKEIGYSLRENSKIDAIEAYDKSIINKISQLGEDIILKITDLQKITIGDEIIKSNEALTLLALRIKDIVVNEKGFKEISELLYKGIYEGSGGGNNRIINLFDKEPDKYAPMMLIKRIRGGYEHIGEHAEKKVKYVLDFNKQVIGKPLPTTEKDWKNIQLEVYSRVYKMLDDTFLELNK